MAEIHCAGIATLFDDALVATAGDDATCRRRFAADCLAKTSPMSGMSLELVRACTDRMAGLSKAGWRRFYLDDDPCGIPAGKIADGDACAFDIECASRQCDRGFSMSGFAHPKCGTCRRLPHEGEACPQYLCEFGLRCVAGACAGPAKEGACGEAGCVSGRSCVGGRCVDDVGEGEACDAYGKRAPACDSVKGLECSGTSPRVCVRLTLAKEGERCGLSDDGLTHITCRGDLRCVHDKPKTAADLVRFGVCGAFLPLGAACENAFDSGCEPPALCIDGACKVPSIEACRGDAGDVP